MIFGPLLVLVVLFARGGLLGLAAQVAAWWRKQRAEPHVAEPVLRLEGLHKNFGGLAVTDNVTFEVAAGELHAVIGPNGAGKTTLINQISGLLAPDAGRIVFAGRDVTALPVPERAALGLARSFQITSILPGFSVLENVALAVQARIGSSFRFFGRAAAETGAQRAGAGRARRGRARRRAPTCSPAISRTAKSARSNWPSRSPCSRSCCCSTSRWPAPAARKTERLIDVLSRLKGRFPMLLVEHDMTAVFALADRISVLIYGRILASGTPDAVRADPQVVAAYLGEEME